MALRRATFPTGNQFLDNMPEAAKQALGPLLEHTALHNGRILYEIDQHISEVFFPLASVLSVVLDMADGKTAEVGIIGCEGMSGLPLALGQSSSNQRTVVQVSDSAHCMPADVFCGVLEREPQLRAFSMRYAQATIMACTQLAACNGLHSLDERCARWLLMAHDRVAGDVVLLTQEFLGQMLGVRRAGVTLAASALQRAGFISYTRGHISVKNRGGLEAAACECYGAVQRNWETLMGYPIGRKKLNGAYPGNGEAQDSA